MGKSSTVGQRTVDVCKDLTLVQIMSPLFLSSLNDLVAVLT